MCWLLTVEREIDVALVRHRKRKRADTVTLFEDLMLKFNVVKNVVLCSRFNFYDGPPFATGLPHYGHILAGTIKDIVTRFAHQSGFHVDRRFGWDCHGLPVVCVINLPTDRSVGSSFHGVSCSSVMFMLLLRLAWLLEEKWKFFVHCIALAFVS